MTRSSNFPMLLKPYAKHLLITAALLVLLVLTNMALPYFMKILIDDIFPSAADSPKWHRLFYLLPGIGIVYIFRNFFFFSSRMKTVSISEDLCFSLRKQLFEKLRLASINFYHINDPGGIGTRVMDDTFKVQSFIQEKLPTLILDLLTAVVLITVLFKTNILLASLCLIVIPAQLFLYKFFKLHIKRSHASSQASSSAIYSNLLERFLGIEVVRIFNAEEREMRQFINSIQQNKDIGMKTQRYLFLQKVGADLLIGASIVILLGTGAMQVKREIITAGTFFMFFSYVGMFYPAILGILSGFSHLNKTSACLERVDELINNEDDKHSQTEPIPKYSLIPSHIKGDIELINVSFGYKKNHKTLKNINLKIKAGERIGITGPCGSGKTTLINLLVKFITPETGSIYFDGKDINFIDKKNLRNISGLVPQEIYLFNAPIIENLLYAKPDSSFEDVEKAAEVTESDLFIRQLSEGYYSRIGSKGVKLSKGQKQALCLSRTILKNAPILLMDEATSSIDKPTTLNIVDNVLNLMKDKTAIIISHESEVLEKLDRIIHLEYGEITFDGPVDEYDKFNRAVNADF